MQAFNLIREANFKVNYNVACKIGEGADGDVYTLDNKPEQVIKFCVNYDWEEDFTFSKIEKVLSILRGNVPGFCKVFDYQYVGKGSRTTYDGKQDFHLYYYVMEKLDKISDDEMKVFHTILSHEDSNNVKDFTSKQLHENLTGLSYGLEFDLVKVKCFYRDIRDSKIIHNDIHPRNIMKDKQGNYKLIDFDRTYLKQNGD